MKQAETLARTTRSKVLCFAIPACLALHCPEHSKLILLHTQDFPVKTLIFSWYRSPTSVLPLTFASQRSLPFTHATADGAESGPPIFLLNVSRILLTAKASVVTHTKLPCLEAQDLSFALQLFQGFEYERKISSTEGKNPTKQKNPTNLGNILSFCSPTRTEKPREAHFPLWKL